MALVWGLFQAAGVWRSVTSKSGDEVRAAALAATVLVSLPHSKCVGPLKPDSSENVTRLWMLQKDSGKARHPSSPITDSRVADLFKRVDVNGARLREHMGQKSVLCTLRDQIVPGTYRLLNVQ